MKVLAAWAPRQAGGSSPCGGEDDRWMMWRLAARHPAALLATPTTTVGAADYTVLKKLSSTRC